MCIVKLFVATLFIVFYLSGCTSQAQKTVSSNLNVEDPIFAYDKEFDDYADCHDDDVRNRKILIVSHDKFYDDMFYDFAGPPELSWSGKLPSEGEKVYIVFYRSRPSDDEINNNPLLYKPEGYIELEDVKAKFPIDPLNGKDFRYVPFYPAHNDLKEAMLSSWSEVQVHHYADLMFHLRTRFCIAAGG